MIAHTTLPVSNLKKSLKFYATVLKTLGYRNNMREDDAAGFNDGKNTDLWLAQKKKVIPTHLAFQTTSRARVEAFYRAALRAGATDNGAPGYRDFSPGYFAAFFIDADGHNIEAVWYDPKKEKKARSKR